MPDTSVWWLVGGGLLVGASIGFAARSAKLCSFGAIEDALMGQDTRRLRVFALALGIAVLGTQGLVATGWLDLKLTNYAPPALPDAGDRDRRRDVRARHGAGRHLRVRFAGAARQRRSAQSGRHSDLRRRGLCDAARLSCGFADRLPGSARRADARRDARRARQRVVACLWRRYQGRAGARCWACALLARDRRPAAATDAAADGGGRRAWLRGFRRLADHDHSERRVCGRAAPAEPHLRLDRRQDALCRDLQPGRLRRFRRRHACWAS